MDLQPALTHGRHLAQHGNEALLVHPLEQLQRLQAVEVRPWLLLR